jgi:glucuronate isomerase
MFTPSCSPLIAFAPNSISKQSIMASLQQVIFDELDSIVLVDSHSHINPRSPASETIADLLGYHYYTELVHSAGMARETIEQANLSPEEKVGRLFESLHEINHTVQWSWFVDLSRHLFGFTEDSIDQKNWKSLYDQSLVAMKRPGWETEVLTKSKIERIFLTNDFDDPLDDFDTHRYVPCLRTDDLVFHLHLEKTRTRLAASTSSSIHTLEQLHRSLGLLFDRFVKNNAKACAISLPPWFTPRKVPLNDPATAEAFHRILAGQSETGETDKAQVAYWVFWRLAEFCTEYRLPFDLMIGVNRRVYPGGVYQGQDLYDSRWSMIQYADLLNEFPNVKFPISVLASVSNQELVDYAWIFPNVIAHGHWWYSNTPSFIRHDLQARLDAVPRGKLIGYYSDAYKLEFILPKYRMYKRILAECLAETICIGRGQSESFAIELGKQILRGNVDSIFFSN